MGRPEYNKEMTRKFVATEISKIKTEGRVKGLEIFFQRMGERLIDGLVLLFEGGNDNYKGLGLEFLRTILDELESDAYLSPRLLIFTNGVRLSIYGKDNPLEVESVAVDDVGDPLILASSGLVDGVFHLAYSATKNEEAKSKDHIIKMLFLLAFDGDRSVHLMAKGAHGALNGRGMI